MWKRLHVRFVLFALLALVPLLLVGRMHAAAETIHFQGKLTNPDGTNVTDGSYSVVFTIYDGGTASGGGTNVWAETQSVGVSDGIFDVQLGTVNTALPTAVDFTHTPLYLSLKVGADAEMTPRILFSAAPYAFNADKLGGIDSSGYVQLSPSSQQTGSINIDGNVSAGSALAFTAASAASIQSASAQALNITGNASSLVSTTSGTLTLQSGTGTVSLGTSTNLTANGALSVKSTGANALTLDSGTTGGVNLGTGANAKALTIGNTTAGTTITNYVGAGTAVYSIQGAAATYLSVNATSNIVYVGGSTAVATPTLFVLGAKTATGDPTGTNGALYYNSADGDFKAYQNGNWATVQPVRYAYLPADVTRAATSYANVTGLSFTVDANKDYDMTCTIIYRSAATTTGIGIALNGPATPTLVTGQFISNSSATALNGRSFNAYNGTGKTTGVQTANADTYGMFHAYFHNGTTAGTLQLRVASETTTTVTIRANSFCKLAEL